MTQIAKKRSSTGMIASLLIIGILVGVALVYATSYRPAQTVTNTVSPPPEVVTLTQTQTQTLTATASTTSTATEPALPGSLAQLPPIVPPVNHPTGWQTSTAKALGVTLAAEYNSSGPAAWNATAHPLVYVTSNGLGYYGAPRGTPTGVGITLVDANTYQVILTQQYAIANQTTYTESGGLGVSMDGRYIYLPTGNPNAPTTAQRGQIIVIDARTLKVHQIIEGPASIGFNQLRAFRLYNGTDVVLAVPFPTQSINAVGPVPGAASGGAIFLMDDSKDNQVIGGFPTSSEPTLIVNAFAGPDGEHLFTSACDTTVPSGNSIGNQPGEVFVIDMKTWTTTVAYPGAGPGACPGMFTFTGNGRYAYYTDSSVDIVTKIDNVAQAQVQTGGSPTVGAYGISLNYNQTQLYITGGGPGHGNAGLTIGEMNAATTTPINEFVPGTTEADSAIINPAHTDEIWLSASANDRDVAFDTITGTTVATMTHSGSSYNGAFVTYTVLPNGQWQGSLLSDQGGLHGAALIAQEKVLGVTSVVYGTATYKTEDQRVLPGENP